MAPVLFQPIAGDDVAKAVGRVAVGAPLNGLVEVAGPEQFRMDEFFRKVLADQGSARGGHRRACPLLRDRAERAIPGADR